MLAAGGRVGSAAEGTGTSRRNGAAAAAATPKWRHPGGLPRRRLRAPATLPARPRQAGGRAALGLLRTPARLRGGGAGSAEGAAPRSGGEGFNVGVEVSLLGFVPVYGSDPFPASAQLNVKYFIVKAPGYRNRLTEEKKPDVF